MFRFTKPAAAPGQALVFFATMVGMVLPALIASPVAAQDKGQDKAAVDGLFLSVPNPITQGTVTEIRKKIEYALNRGRKIKTVVFDFNPQGKPNSTSSFGSCVELADFIKKVNDNLAGLPPIYTVAFVHDEVSRHSVLPVLTCKQIVLSDERDATTQQIRARLGDINKDLDFQPYQADAYKRLPDQRISPDLVQRMIHKDLVLKWVSLPIKSLVSLKSHQELVDKFGADKVSELKLPADLQAGNALFDADLLNRLGISSIKNTPLELAQSLGLPVKSLKEDWLAGRTAVPWRIEARGPIDRGKLDSMERRIKAAIGKGANFIILQLEGDGGDTTHVGSTAEFLRNLRDQNLVPVKTVAYVPAGQTLGTATFLALGCDEIVMGPGAVLADFAYLKEEDRKPVAKMLKALAAEQHYPALLFEASLDKDLVLYRVQSARDATDVQLVSEKEVLDDEKANPPRWAGKVRKDRPAGSLQELGTDLAGEFHIAQSVDRLDFNSVCALYELDTGKVHVSRDDWLDQVAEFFRSPVVNFLLIMFGIIGLILEMKMPGTTVPGVIAAICFVLFFWSYSFVGEFALLAVLLFVLGLILIALEIFIIPGFGFPGIAGLMLIITSLVLATMERMPQSPQDWVNLGTTFGTFGLGLVAAIVAAFLLAWYLPSIPYANRLVLQPPQDDVDGLDTTGRAPANAALLGAIGVAATPLRPAGKAQFGDDFLDVIAEGDYVKPGSRVQIIELEGNRIVVKEI